MLPPERFADLLVARLPELMRAAIAEARRADQPFGCVLADFTSGAAQRKGGELDREAIRPGHAEVNAL